MAQPGFNHFGGGQTAGGNVDPNDLAMSGTYGSSSYSNNFSGNNNTSGFFDDDELLDGLGNQGGGMHNQEQDFGGMNQMNMGFSQGMYPSHQNNPGLQMDQPHMNGYSHTPDGDPIQSPFVHSFNQAQFRQMQHHQSFGNSLQSPVSYSGSPLAGSDGNNNNNSNKDANYLDAGSRARLSQTMQRKPSNNTSRSPLTPKTTAAMSAMSMGTQDSPGFGAQPIRTPNGHHEKSPSGQWMQTPNSLSSFPGSGFSSPMQHNMQNPQIADVLMKGGTSMPAKLGGPNAISSQEMKRKRRRESHNLVERRRRDNINERIQDLSKLVPPHRLEDEKIRKLIQNGTPLSPSLTGMTHPSQATSGLAGPGAKRATGAGNITTGLPLEEKDKGPNKGDILNGSVSWTRDLMWMLHLKLQQQEELMNYIVDLGGSFPIELTEDEKRMQTELMEAMSKNGPHTFSYSRFAGSGLRVPEHTDFKGDPLNGAVNGVDGSALSPDDHSALDLNADIGDPGILWNDPDDDGSGPASIGFKEEDEYGMDLTS
jgi:hypothetical protein